MLWDASVTLRGILQKNIDETSKKNSFQKKIKKYVFIEEIGHFHEQKSANIPQNPGNFEWEINGKRFSLIFDFH